MDLIALAIMSRAIAPTGAKSAKLQSLPFNARAIAADVAQDITDRFALFHSCDLHRSLQSGYMHAFVHLVHDMPSGALLDGITCASNTALRDSEPAAKLRGFYTARAINGHQQ